MVKVLIVDDDLHLRKLVKTYAQMDNIECDEVENGKKALDKIHGNAYDLVVLDVMMPGMDGFETMAELRKISNVPVIFLTSRKEEYDRLLGFNLGADDYVSKPFSPKELIARINAVINRSGKGRKNSQLQFGELTIVEDSHTVRIGEKTIHLTPKEFDLLLYLAKNNKIALSREQLLEKVWGYEYSGDTRTVDTHVKGLRERIGDCRYLISTVWGVGYKFEYTEKE